MSDEMTALRNEIRALTARLDRLEKGRSSDDEENDPFDLFAKSVHERLRQSRDENGLPYALGIANAVMQTNRSGNTGTALGLWTVDTLKDLPDDDKLERSRKRYVPLLTDPLVPKVFRQFLIMAFDSKPMQATAAELAAALSTTPETIETLLAPLIEDRTLERGLSPEGVPFYEWDGNNHRILMLLFQD